MSLPNAITVTQQDEEDEAEKYVILRGDPYLVSSQSLGFLPFHPNQQSRPAAVLKPDNGLWTDGEI